MAEIIKVDRPVGINTSVEPSQLPPETWSNGYNVSFANGRSQKFAGYERGFGEAQVVPDVMVPIRDDRQLYYWWGYTGWSEVNSKWEMWKIENSLNHSHVTPEDGIAEWSERPDDYPYRWTSDVLASTPYMTYGIPYAWNDTGSPEGGVPSSGAFEPLLNIPRKNNVYDEDGVVTTYGEPRVRFGAVRTYKNHLVGMNFYAEQYVGDFENGWGSWSTNRVHQDGVWWSHPTEGEGVDVTWQDANPLAQSGWNFLGGSGGPIVDAKQLRDSFIIYRESSVWQMTNVGGVFVMKFQELFNDAGILGLDCILEVEGEHIVIGQSDVYRHNGVRKQSIIDEVMREELFATINPNHYDKVFIVGDYKHNQAWVCVPSIAKEHRKVGGAADQSCDVAFVYDWVGNTWTKRDIPNLTTSIFTILSLPAEDNTWGGGEWGHSWKEQEQDDRSWASTFFKYNPADWGLAMASTDGAIFTQIESTIFDGEGYTATVIKEGLDFGQADLTKHVSRIFPIVRDGIVEVRARMRMGIEAGKLLDDTGSKGDLGSVESLGFFNPATMNHISCRLSGRYMDLQFIIPEDSAAKIQGYRIEVDINGRR